MGKEIQKNRKRAGLTYKKLCGKSGIKTGDTISRLEKGNENYTMDTFIRVSTAIDRSLGIYRKIGARSTYKYLKRYNTEQKCDIIEKTVARCLGLLVDSIRSEMRNVEFVRARFYGFKLMRELTGESCSNIGKRYNRDHSTVVAGIRRLNNWIETRDYLAKLYPEVEEEARNGLKKV
jgi:chromosomal replication initiation ATPase DnaA